MSGDVLEFVDQAAASGTAATGRHSLIQSVWTYETHVNNAGLEQFRQSLAYGLFGRRVQTSPLACARDRWVANTDAPPIHYESSPRARGEINVWLDERAAAPIDPWQGPGWQLSVLALTGGGHVVTLVVSHILADGVGVIEAVATAATGNDIALPYRHAPVSSARAFVRDSVQVTRDIPAVLRSVMAAARLAKNRLEPSATQENSSSDSCRVGAERWCVVAIGQQDLRQVAQTHGGTPTTVLCAISAAIAHALNWTRPSDGAATLGVSVNRRRPNDLRANAIADAHLVIDPQAGAAGIAGVRQNFKKALTELSDVGAFDAFGPLVPLLPRRVIAALIDTDDATPITTCAGMGDLPEAARAPDGTAADSSWLRLTWAPLRGRELRARPPYLYCGWSADAAYATLFVATNIDASQPLDQLASRAVAEYIPNPVDPNLDAATDRAHERYAASDLR